MAFLDHFYFKIRESLTSIEVFHEALSGSHAGSRAPQSLERWGYVVFIRGAPWWTLLRETEGGAAYPSVGILPC